MKAPPKGRPKGSAPALRRSNRKRTPTETVPPFYQGVVTCDNIKHYKSLTRKTPRSFKTGKKTSKKDRRKSTSEMKILSKKAERQQLQSTPTNVEKSKRNSLQPKELFPESRKSIRTPQRSY